MVQVRRGYPARPCKTPEKARLPADTQAQPSVTQVQPVLGRVGLEGGVGNRGSSHPVRLGPGGVFADGRCTCAVPVMVEEPVLSGFDTPLPCAHRDPHRRRPIEACAVTVERRPIHHRVAGLAHPKCVPTAAVSEAGDVTNQN
jgi:hypothetical protein